MDRAADKEEAGRAVAVAVEDRVAAEEDKE